jgi:hypothetical protein
MGGWLARCWSPALPFTKEKEMTKFHEPWPEIKHMHTQYREQHGTQHPERQIDLATFRFRLWSFESAIDERVTERSIRRWCEKNEMNFDEGLESFNVLCEIVDEYLPITWGH